MKGSADVSDDTLVCVIFDDFVALNGTDNFVVGETITAASVVIKFLLRFRLLLLHSVGSIVCVAEKDDDGGGVVVLTVVGIVDDGNAPDADVAISALLDPKPHCLRFEFINGGGG